MIRQYGQPSQVDVRSRRRLRGGIAGGDSLRRHGRHHRRVLQRLDPGPGPVAVATFSNNGGLIRAGDTVFEESRNSGLPQIGAAGTGDRGMMTPGTLEMSNVDLSEEFTSMIITQRGFQANSRIITTSDEMLQELVNLKR